ncbi:DUF6349 family protein [Lysinibacter cavernae]|uniref:DUF6349 family protein n=1 Tax=Lysinibacter cavernae TaxID=1640652 RepID=UPI003621BAC2
MVTPLEYHELQASPADLDAAFIRWKETHGPADSIRRSHMWQRDPFMHPIMAATDSHTLEVFSAQASCDYPDHDHTSNELLGRERFLAICTICDWRRIADIENDVIEAWHDHSLPGWRELPVIPLSVTSVGEIKKLPAKIAEWAEVHYPASWQIPGSPIITERSGSFTRHIPGHSPWGGYKLSDSALASN